MIVLVQEHYEDEASETFIIDTDKPLTKYSWEDFQRWIEKTEGFFGIVTYSLKAAQYRADTGEDDYPQLFTMFQKVDFPTPPVESEMEIYFVEE